MQSQAAETVTPGALAVRAVVPGLAFAAVAGTATIASGGLPEGTAPYVAAGCAAAAVTGAVGAALKARAVARSGTGPDTAQRLQIAIFGDFVIQLLAVGGTMLAMFLAHLKFVYLGGFALAFAAVALGHQFGSSLVLARTLRRRAAGSGAPENASSGEGDAPRDPGVRGGANPSAALGSATSSSGSPRR